MAVGQFDISEFQVHGFIMKANTCCVKDAVSSSVHTLLKEIFLQWCHERTIFGYPKNISVNSS